MGTVDSPIFKNQNVTTDQREIQFHAHAANILAKPALENGMKISLHRRGETSGMKDNIQLISTFALFNTIRIPILATLLFTLGTAEVFAQNNQDTSSISMLSIKAGDQSSVDITFNAPEEVGVILIRVTDSSGATVFLENLHRFKGSYMRNIKLSDKSTATYTVEVSNDHKTTEQKVEVK
jgi:hypothetical protein